MKWLAAIALAALVFAAFPGSAHAGRKCPSGEEMVFSIPEERPGWVDKPHYSLGKNEYFTGIATQNDKLEDGIALAVENANQAIVEALGQVIQAKTEGVLTVDADDIRQSFGSMGAATYLKNKERKSIYYEKWAYYQRCRPKYFFNVWVLVKVPKDEIDAQVAQATAYLKKVQQIEHAKPPPELMPAAGASHITERPVAAAETPDPEDMAPIVYPPETVDLREPFKCTSVGLYGGYTYMPTFGSSGSRQKGNTFNINADFEFGITRNICMGFGMGYTMTKREWGGHGHIIPFFTRVSYKAPFDFNRRFIGWIGAELGGAVLSGMDRNDGGTKAAFMAGPAAGIDIRLQKSLYLTVGASYTPIFYKDTIHMIQGRVGIRYYFW